jgi:hypothetical protein
MNSINRIALSFQTPQHLHIKVFEDTIVEAMHKRGVKKLYSATTYHLVRDFLNFLTYKNYKHSALGFV